MNRNSFTNLYPVTSFLLLLNGGFFILQMIAEDNLNIGRWEASKLLGAVNGKLIHDGQPWRLISGTFLHGAWWHIGFNCMALLSLGRFLEPLLSKSKFFSVYMLSALSSSLVSYSWPAMNLQTESLGELASVLLGQQEPTGPRWAVRYFEGHTSVGCSGAVFGLFGLMLVYFIKQRHPGLKDVLVQFFPMFIVFAFVFPAFGVRLDHAGHIGGFITGGICGLTVSDFATSQTSLRWRIPAGLTGLALVASLAMAVYKFAIDHWEWN